LNFDFYLKSYSPHINQKNLFIVFLFIYRIKVDVRKVIPRGKKIFVELFKKNDKFYYFRKVEFIYGLKITF
jgi:hypothetical protein